MTKKSVGKRDDDPLLGAVRQGALAVLLEPEHSAAIRKRGPELLVEALSWGQLRAFDALLRHGAPFLGKRGTHTPLHAAAFRDEPKAVRRLLEAGASVDAPDAQGHTPLHLAAMSASPTTLRLLLASGANVEVRDRSGMTPLMHVALRDSPPWLQPKLKALLEAGATLTVKDREGLTVLERLERFVATPSRVPYTKEARERSARTIVLLTRLGAKYAATPHTRAPR